MTRPRNPLTTGAHLPMRRDVLRMLGLGSVGLGGAAILGACSNRPDRATPSGSTSATSTSTTVAPEILPTFDPDVPYWLQGNFAPVHDEVEIVDLPVRGALPPELSGLFVRNGSNPPGGDSAHWFLGDGMLHGIRIERGRARWYRNRYVDTPIRRANADLLSFGQIPGEENTQSNIALVHHAGRLLSLGETGWPYEISPDDLETIGPWDHDGRLGPTMTAHPKIDPATGRLHLFGYGLLAPGLTYSSVDPSGVLDTSIDIEMDGVVMIHDFAITDREAIFWIGPVVFGADPANPYPDIPFHWDPDGPSEIIVVPFDGADRSPRRIDIDPRFVFHGMNAHRDGDDIVLIVHELEEAFGRGGDLLPSHLTEWTIGTGEADLTFASRKLSDRPMDLPSHDRRHTGRPTRHAWCATTTDPDGPHGFELAGICHVDTVTGAEDLWDPPDHLRAGEGVFVPNGDDEGDGHVVTFLWDRSTDRSSFAVFEAQDVAAGPIAEVDLPVRVPFGFHGLWIDEADL